MSLAGIRIAKALVAFAVAAPACLAQTPSSKELPLKYAGPATSPAISAGDLMTRLYIFADDSMMGREVGTIYHLRSTAYIEREVRRLHLVPAGDDGGYFQNLPIYRYYADSASWLRIDGIPAIFGDDFLPYAAAEQRVSLAGVPVVYGGVLTDSTTWLTAEDAAGKIVFFSVRTTSTPARNFQFDARSRLARAALILVGSFERIPRSVRPYLAQRTVFVPSAVPLPGPPTAFVTTTLARAVFGDLDSLRAGTTGKNIDGTIILHRARAPGRNVAAILPGSDPALRGQYVAIGAHNDHVGFNHTPVDHDSTRLFNMIARPQGEDSPPAIRLTPEQGARFRTMLDSVRAQHPARMDSIFNGADDDGTGTVSLLEIAEAFAASPARPKRSILFVWHAGEEKGLWGSQYYTDHPTVPRDSIVAQLNMDMVGRGRATDITGETRSGEFTHGGPGYLQLVGSRRLSTELGTLIESVNKRVHPGLTLDYSMDANGHRQNIYCRSDHYEYARYGIPIAFLTTGGHSDYHQVTDEPQYIDYEHLAQVANFVQAVVAEVANLDHRIVVDKPKPDPTARCVQ